MKPNEELTLESEVQSSPKDAAKATPENCLIDVWKYGGGTQSVAIAALIILGKIKKPELAVIADTGKERGTTWEYLDSVIQPALNSVGVKIHRVSTEKYCYAHDGVYSGKTILIPAFTNVTGETGKMSGFCNKWWKQDAVNNWLRREQGIKPSKVRSWIGFSADEMPRVFRMMQGEEYLSGRIRFPLVELHMKRMDSINLAKEMGWPTPPRSACWMCPNQTDAEWRDLKENHPAEFALAVETEKQMREKDKNYFLHDSCKPLDIVNLTRPDDLFWRACDPKERAACFT